MIVSTSEELVNIGHTGYKINNEYFEKYRNEVHDVLQSIKRVQQSKHESNYYLYRWSKLSLRQKIAMWLLKKDTVGYNAITENLLLETYHECWNEHNYVAECTVWELGKGWFIARDNTESKKKEIERIDKEIQKLEGSMSTTHS
jgi:hypothetical protein